MQTTKPEDLKFNYIVSRTSRWLNLARITWLFLLFLGMGLYSVNIPRHLETLIASPEMRDPLLQYFSISQQDVQILARLGLPSTFYPLFVFSFEIIWVLSFLIPSVIVLWRKSPDPMGLFVSFMFLTYGFVATPLMYMVFLETYPVMRFLSTLLGGLSFAAIFVFWFVFPDGHFYPRWTRYFVIVFVVFALVWLFTYILFPDFPKLILIYLGAPFFLICFIFGLFAQASRYRVVSGPLQRQQTKWVLFGFVATAIGMSLVILPLLLFPSTLENSGRVWYLLFSTPVTVLSMTLLPLSITLSILRYRLWDIDVIIRRTLVYSLLTGALLVLYFSLVVGLQAIFQAITGQQRSPVATVLSTLAIAALFSSLRKRIQDGIDRRFYRRRYDAEKILAAFGTGLREEVDLDQLRVRLLAIVQETMQPESASLWLKKPAKGSTITRFESNGNPFH